MGAVAGVPIVPGVGLMTSSPAGMMLVARAADRGISVMLVLGGVVVGDGWHRGPPHAAVFVDVTVNLPLRWKVKGLALKK